MHNPLRRSMAKLIWQGGWALLVVGLAILSGRFVEDAARAHQVALRAQSAPQAITPLSGSETLGDTLLVPTRLVALGQGCTPDLKLSAQNGAIVALTLTAACAADQPVEISHAGVTFAVRMPTGQPLQMNIPALEENARFAVTLASGESLLGQVPVPGLAAYRRFAITWQGEAELRLLGVEGGGDWVSASDPGLGAHGSDGWVASLGEADLDLPRQAQIYTYPVRNKADVVLELTATSETCGTRIIGQTVSSRLGQADRTDLSVDLAHCGERSAVMHLKNLDRDVKLAAR